jgi:hypothetical protein
VYGNGKFGIADRGLIENRPGLTGPFAAEMLTVWMIRNFTHDLAEHVGQGTLDRRFKTHLGIGNSTGLGMAPFLVTHPVLLNNWMLVRETALARVRAIPSLERDQQNRLQMLAERAAKHLDQWDVPDPKHQARIEALRKDWAATRLTLDRLSDTMPLDHVMLECERFSEDIQELMASLILEPFDELVDGLTDCMADPVGPIPEYSADTEVLKAAVDQHFSWALTLDYDAKPQCQQFWYVSEAKLEPRLGDRFDEPGSERESPLDIARRIAAMYADLPETAQSTATFLAAHPQHGLAIDRVQLATRYPYGEIHDNMIAADCLPIDMLRCKLSFFGASKFDPKSDLWTRITLCQGAPLRDELNADADNWWLPVYEAD